MTLKEQFLEFYLDNPNCSFEIKNMIANDFYIRFNEESYYCNYFFINLEDLTDDLKPKVDKSWNRYYKRDYRIFYKKLQPIIENFKTNLKLQEKLPQKGDKVKCKKI